MIKNKPYLAYSDVLKAKFGCKVYKVTIDAGFSCPNRDGTKGFGGCIFCDETGSSSRAQEREDSITAQILQNIEKMRKRFHAEKFIAYFQPYTNTYGSVERLKCLYDEAISAHSDIVGLSISTRPDSIDKEKLELIASYSRQDRYISLEYGMQTVNNRTLKAINRCETHEDFLNAFYMTKESGIPICIHVILGLPGETYEDMMTTAAAIKQLQPDGIKIHLLCAMKNTLLERMYLRGEWQPLEQNSYIELVSDFIKEIGPGIAIHRLAGNGHRDALVAPRWLLKKHEILEQIGISLSKHSINR